MYKGSTFAWSKLKKPFFALAPMDDVTDTVFRQVVAGCARPDVFFTEFVSVDGLQSKGRQAIIRKLQFTQPETPLIAQVWGMNPDNYQKTATELRKMKFAGIDINMGCPVPKVVKLGACSALINNRQLVSEIIQATKDGVAGKIPVSIKTRLGFSDVDLGWTQFLLEQRPDALTIHGRTAKQLSKGKSNWDLIGEVRKQRDQISPKTVIIGNGDVKTRIQGEELANKYQLDGIMIGRGVFDDPYVFSDNSMWNQTSKEDRLDLFKKHVKLFITTWGTDKNSATLKKFAKVYVSGFDGAGKLRARIMTTNSTDELLDVLTVDRS